ncbi:hypothetical protein HNY73_011590 [Argiope bruennichi]|uniref:Uncharacterized protein n=1 Tax=Argiope bruennichi TaxID=94029 RepID=A0A8T0F038_ARGBR|nr:hypothetical protein HNY73_011590 [Argiope bruennichi]
MKLIPLLAIAIQEQPSKPSDRAKIRRNSSSKDVILVEHWGVLLPSSLPGHRRRVVLYTPIKAQVQSRIRAPLSDHKPFFNSSQMAPSTRYLFSKANWAFFSVMANITKNAGTAEKIMMQLVSTDNIIAAADCYSKSGDTFQNMRKPWLEQECNAARQETKRAWNKSGKATNKQDFLYIVKQKVRRDIRRRVRTVVGLNFVYQYQVLVRQKKWDQSKESLRAIP